jgi:PAS domain S-box-containing protein
MNAAALHARPRVLVVDDEMGPRESLRMLLKLHYEIRTAASAPAALEALQEFRPDLVILDIKMPEMDGLEALRRIKRFDPSIEVVMITAYASLETVKLALSHGAFEYLIKPFSRQDLEDVVRRALLRRQTDLGTRSQLARLVEEMRSLSAKTRQLEEAARREAAEQSLRVTQLSILREIARAIVGQLDVDQLTAAVSDQLRRALGYDAVGVIPETATAPAPAPCVVTCAIRDAEGPLGWLVVDNRASGRAIDPRERELLEMLSEYLAVAVRNSRLYTEIATTKRSLEQLIASAGDGIIAVDRDDRVDGWNPAAERIFGQPAREAVGRAATEFLPATHYHPARRRLEAGSPMEVFEVTVARPGGGQPAALQVTLSALRDRQGGFAGLIAIVRDITVQREMESQLNQSEKLTALGQLAGGIAHDFNNLLQAILGYAQLMKQNLSDAELVRRSLQVLESAALDGSETVRRIQQFARLRPDEQFVPVDLNRIVHEAIAIIRPRWDEKIAQENRRLDLRLDLGNVPPVNGRPAALTELLTNLFLNAIDAMPEGGVLSVATRREGDQAVVQVADTGVGMSEAVRRRIFEPFFSTKGEGGSGLGLAMVYSIVKRHGGEIRVESELGRGAVFTLTFPAAGEPRPEPNGAAAAGPRRRARILLVDDDPQVLRVLDDTLRGLGHAVTALPNGPAALAAYQPGRFDVVLTNVGMAGMNGWEFAERLRARDARVPLLFITGWGLREEDNARLGALAVQRCLYKPVKPTDLDLAIQAAIPAASPAR